MYRILDPILRALSSVPPPLVGILGGLDPSVMLYHGVPKMSPLRGTFGFDSQSFEKQVVALKNSFEIIHPRDIHEHSNYLSRRRIVLTFDDGMLNNFTQAASILKNHQVPAMFFISTRHISSRHLLWFNYLNVLKWKYDKLALVFRDKKYNMNPTERIHSIQKITEILLGLPQHPSGMYDAIENELPPWETFLSHEDARDWVAGMAEENVRELADDQLFVIGAHTVDHPLLTRCTHAEVMRQIGENKEHLEFICQKKIDAIAYPSGDYDLSTIDICKGLGFESGHAVIPRFDHTSFFEIPRAGIYRNTVGVALFKAMWARRRLNGG